MRQPCAVQTNERGGEIIQNITEKNVGRYLAIILDNNVMSYPVIKERIPKESCMQGALSIQLNSMQDINSMWKEAEDLVIVLRAGSLPAPVEVLNNRSVGPSLGRDSIAAGQQALIWGCIFVVLFMLIYYVWSGVVANIALLLNVFFILAALALLQATLTLPGIAGLVLTIGMAVDANVIIFERIREELRVGKTPKAAIQAGYDKAHLTILDANVTTIIAGIVLLQYGTGPIQGFAVTLILGIISSYITSLWISKVIFQVVLQLKGLKRLSMGISLKNEN